VTVRVVRAYAETVSHDSGITLPALPSDVFLHVAEHRPGDGFVTVWVSHRVVELDAWDGAAERRLSVVPTDAAVETSGRAFVGTAVFANGEVWHVLDGGPS
jgi:hypothetical protein